MNSKRFSLGDKKQNKNICISLSIKNLFKKSDIRFSKKKPAIRDAASHFPHVSRIFKIKGKENY